MPVALDGRLKHDYGLAPLRCRGLDRVQLHADLTMLARLGQALLRARAIPLAAWRRYAPAIGALTPVPSLSVAPPLPEKGLAGDDYFARPS